jgi:quinol monooxygenase YgiN
VRPIHYLVEFSVKDGKLDDFKQVADWFVERCEADEPGTASYQWYLSQDGTKCYLHEAFNDSAGLVAHAGGPNVQGRIGDLLETADITRFEAFGNPDEAAAEVLASFNAVVYPHYAGFTR